MQLLQVQRILLTQEIKQPKLPKPDTLHLKYVDDLSVLESINFKSQLSDNHEREQPDNYRSRTGHQLLPRCTMGTGGELKWRMSGIICSFTLSVTYHLK